MWITQNIAKKIELKTSANVLTKHALKILDLKGFHVWRQNNGGVYDAKKNCYRANSSTPGISDIIGFNRKTGQFIACEIKAGKDKLSIEQDVFLKRVNDAGGIGMVVRSVQDLETFLKK
jgi:VRR-NUC domain